MSSPLERLAGPGKALAAEPPDAEEIAGLLRSGRVRHKDAERASNSLESRFDLAYNAAHALCLAALRHHGFRPANRYIVFQVLPHTLGLGPEVWRVLAKCHEIRNLGEYEGDLDIDERIVADLITALVADRRLQEHYVDQVEPMIEMCEVIDEQNQRLRTARDLLLPRLMSGEVSV